MMYGLGTFSLTLEATEGALAKFASSSNSPPTQEFVLEVQSHWYPTLPNR